MIYLDSSALVKLVVQEQESEHLTQWLAARGDQPWVCSVIGPLEVVRAVRRSAPAAVAAARDVGGRCDLVSLSGSTLRAAQDLGPLSLRALDAIHLASATSLGTGLEAFVAYDRRLLEAGVAVGLPVASPGAEPA